MTRRRRPCGKSLLIGVLAVVTLIVGACAAPPTQQVDAAKVALAEAEAAEAETYAPEDLEAARSAMDAVQAELRAQEAKFALFRSYERIDALAAETVSKAQEAKETALIRAMQEGIATTTADLPAEAVPVSDLLVRGLHRRRDYGAYAYLLFTQRPRPEDEARYLKACTALFTGMPTAASLLEVLPAAALLATHWPVGDAVSNQCEDRLLAYDYDTAARLVAAVKRSASAGPLLAAWRRPYDEALSAGDEALVFDLSDFSDEDLERAIRVWKDQISSGPDHWQGGWKLVIFRESLRNFMITYGDTILAVVTDAD